MNINGHAADEAAAENCGAGRPPTKPIEKYFRLIPIF